MSYRRQIFFLVSFVFTLLLLAPVALSATGEMEMTGFTVSNCGDCHGATPKYPLRGAKTSYEVSGHKNNANSYYANGSGCQVCHTNEGFIDYMQTGKIDNKAYISDPSQPGCFTCHEPHVTGDYSLRTVKPVTLVNGSVFDLGDGNLCANCHHARQDATAIVAEMEASKISSHWGAHHGPQSDVVSGTNAYEFPGQQYSSSAHKKVLEDGCVQCHMALPEGRYALSPYVGGHSFNIVGEVHEAEKLNVAGCVSCHKDIKQVRGTEIYNLEAKADYDNDGSVEPVQAEVEGLLEILVNDHGSGLLQKLSPPMYKPDGSWNSAKEGTRSEVEVGALYNYKFFLEDRSRGAHNAIYTIQVLYDTIEALDSSFDTSKRPR